MMPYDRPQGVRIVGAVWAGYKRPMHPAGQRAPLA